MQVLEFHKPSDFFSDPVNYYSLLHFIEYSLLSLVSTVKIKHIWILSISWEIIELFVHYNWARESWVNKFFDLIFNFSGFWITRKVLKLNK